MADIRMTLYFEWDEGKAASNLRKHRISFDTATSVFLDPARLERLDKRMDYGEDRFATIGLVGLVVVVVVHTQRDDTIRLISARKAERHEQRQYWENRALHP